MIRKEETMMKRYRVALMALILACVGPGVTAQTIDDYPSRPIRIVQGFPPGGNADTVARLIGHELFRQFGKPVVVEAKPGAGGTIASDLVARAPADGYTLMLVTGGHAVAGAMYKSLPYRSVESFEMVSTISMFPFILSTHSGGQYQSLKDLITAARLKHDGVSYGAAGPGATQHLVGELLASVINAKLLYVPYKGDATAVTALLGKEIDFIVSPGTAVLGHVKAGTFKAVAVTGSSRWSGMPDVPTVAESGVPGYQVSSWLGIATTAGVPATVVAKLNAAVREAVNVPEVRAKLEQIGGQVRVSSPSEMRDMVASEIAQWSRVIDRAGIERR
jgi:tripartite-type tricarboxylate transporter receptor subunit TctC